MDNSSKRKRHWFRVTGCSQEYAFIDVQAANQTEAESIADEVSPEEWAWLDNKGAFVRESADLIEAKDVEHPFVNQ